MPPRFAYWTIIIDNMPTAFRARDRADLIPTLRQLQSRNPTATMKWFSQGKLWESPEAARSARRAPKPPRGPGWRPGGRHEDPRARFKKKPRPAAGRTEAERGVEPATRDTPPSEPEAPPPEPPPGPDRPPTPGHEPGPDVPNPETIRILPEPPERAKKAGPTS